MSLDSGYSYGRTRKAPKKPVWRRPWFIGVAAAVVVVMFAVTMFAPKTTNTEPVPPAAQTVEPTPEATHRHEHSAGATRAAWTALNTFLNGWTSTDQDTRQKVFAQTVIIELADGLGDTIPENVVTAPITHVDVAAASPYSTEFLVWFEKDDVPTWVLLTSGHADGTNSYDWRVSEIEKRPL